METRQQGWMRSVLKTYFYENYVFVIFYHVLIEIRNCISEFFFLVVNQEQKIKKACSGFSATFSSRVTLCF